MCPAELRVVGRGLHCLRHSATSRLGHKAPQVVVPPPFPRRWPMGLGIRSRSSIGEQGCAADLLALLHGLERRSGLGELCDVSGHRPIYGDLGCRRGGRQDEGPNRTVNSLRCFRRTQRPYSTPEDRGMPFACLCWLVRTPEQDLTLKAAANINGSTGDAKADGPPEKKTPTAARAHRRTSFFLRSPSRRHGRETLARRGLLFVLRAKLSSASHNPEAQQGRLSHLLLDTLSS